MLLAPTLLLNAGSGAAIARPTFSRDFAGEKTLNNGTGPAITFTRASNATFFDANGTLQTASNDAPRFDHSGGSSLGLLIEEARTNSMIRSAEFDDAAWNKTNATVTANSATSPDGTTTADTLTSANTTATMAINNAPQVAYAAGTYTWSWFVKTNGWQWVQLRSSAALSSAYANFDIVNGVVGTASGATASLTNVGNGWFRIAVSFAVAAQTGDWALNLVTATDSARNSTTTGNGTSSIFIWGAQLEAGAFPTSYIPTTSAAATRAADSAVVTPISSFYNQAEGTLFAEFIDFGNVDTTFPSIMEFNDNSFDNRFLLGVREGAGRHARFSAFKAGAIDRAIAYSGSNGVIAQNTVAKMSAGYAPANYAVSANGLSVVTSTDPATMPSGMTVLTIGRNRSEQFQNAFIRKLAYYPRRLSNTLLQQLTT